MPHSRSLQVGGVQWFSSLDFPGQLSAVLFCQGCALKCVYCQNPDLIPVGAGTENWDSILDQLESRQGLLDAVVFSGGEPLVQSGLAEAIAEVRGLGFKIGLHTSGMAPGLLARICADLDWVGLDIKTTAAASERVTGSAGTHDKAWAAQALLIEHGIPHEIRTTVWPGAVDEDAVRSIARRAARCGTQSFALQEALHPDTRDVMPSPVFTDAGLLDELGRLFDRFDCRRAS